MRIQEVEKAVGISKKNIRFYEDEGLLTPKRELGNGYRDYSEEDLRTLQIIKLLRKLSVPLEEIRKLQSGSLNLTDTMQRHSVLLNSQLRNLQQVRSVCQELGESEQTLSTLQLDFWETRIEKLEEEGTKFMNVSSDQKRRKTGSLLSAAVSILFLGLMIGILIWAAAEDPIPAPVLVLLLACFIVPIVGIILALKERLNEIKRGEEDEAIKY